MHTRITLTICAFVLVGGCAAPVGPLVLGTNHPANPVAPDAPLPPRSTTLAPNAATIPMRVPQPEMAPMEHMHDGAQNSPTTKAEDSQPAADMAMFTCPMHPEVMSAEPGRCPECNMMLVPMAHDGHNHEEDQ